MNERYPSEIPANRIAVMPDGNLAVQNGEEIVVVDMTDPTHPSVVDRFDDVDLDVHGELDLGEESVFVVDPRR